MSSSPLPDDRSTQARIRDAGIACYGRLGTEETTVGKVAAEAKMSAGSVIHHFGSMEGLRAACDEHVAALVRHNESEAMRNGLFFDPVAASSALGIGQVGAYLAAVLHDNSPIIATLVDELVADAENYIQLGVDAGTVRPSEDPRARAVVLTLWSLGTLVLHDHVKRLLGVDPTDPDADPEAMAAFVGPFLEILSKGIFADPQPPHEQNEEAP